MKPLLPSSHGLAFRPKLYHLVSHDLKAHCYLHINDVLQNGITTDTHSKIAHRRGRPGTYRKPLLRQSLLYLVALPLP